MVVISGWDHNEVGGLTHLGSVVMRRNRVRSSMTEIDCDQSPLNKAKSISGRDTMRDWYKMSTFGGNAETGDADASVLSKLSDRR
jgi:hypothetical protein